MTISGHVSRRGFLQLATGLLVPEPARVRAYSFLSEAYQHRDEALQVRQIMKSLQFAETYGVGFNGLREGYRRGPGIDWTLVEMAVVRMVREDQEAMRIHDAYIIKPKS